MSRVLVTGGTGFLGRHLLALLAKRGEEVRVLTRAAAAPELDGLDVEVVEGSLTDPAAIVRAVTGVSRIYHCAGLVSRDADAAAQMYRLHVDGTRLLLEAAERARVKRVVVVSTSGTVAISRDEEEVSTEESPFRYELAKDWPYYLSKIYEEKLSLEVAARGKLEVVLVNPSLLLGPGDGRLSSTGDVLKFLKRDIPVVPSGGLNFVDARDAAAGAILAMEKGASGQRYLLGGPNWSFGEFFQRLARVSDVRAPTARIPDLAARVGASVVDRLYRWRGGETRAPVDPVSVVMAQHFWYLDAGKARRELGWEPRDPMETLDDTVADLRERHLGGAPPVAKAPSFLESLVTKLGAPERAAGKVQEKEKPLAKARPAKGKPAKGKPGKAKSARR